MKRLLLAATAALAVAVAPAAPAQATTCAPAGCVCDAPCTDCGYEGRGVCIWVHRPLVGCHQTPEAVICL